MGEKNNIIWVTGAATGIGRSISNEFLENGYSVAGSSRREAQLERVKNEVSNNGASFEVYPLDVGLSDQVLKTVKKIERKFDIRCLINNAGVTSFASAENNSIEEIDEIIITNLLGSIYTIQSVLPKMIENKCGTIINILSVAAEKLFTKSSAYSASKAGLLAYTNVLREEVREHNIKVINILPGATKTPIWPNDVLEKISDQMMSPDDIARIVFELYKTRLKLVAEEITLRPITGDL